MAKKRGSKLSRREALRLIGGGVGALSSMGASAQILDLLDSIRGGTVELDDSLVVDALQRVIDPPGTWGRPDSSIYPSRFFPRGSSSYKVLEIHLYGGLSPWENFYHRNVADAGGKVGRGYRDFGQGNSGVTTDLDWHNTDSSPGANNPNLCNGRPNPNETKPFAMTDGANSHQVHFGPATKPLWSGNNHILNRTRVVVMQHNLLPHEAAVPYAATGFRLGQASLAGLGAVIQNRAMAVQNSAPFLLRRTVPWSYVLEKTTGIAMADNIDAYRATGLLGGASKPVSLLIGEQGIVTKLDRREDRSKENEKDALLRYYRDAYRQELNYPGANASTRSRGFADYNASLETALNAESLAQMLNGSLQSVGNNQVCVTLDGAQQPPAVSNAPASGIRSAAALLKNRLTPARYVCVIDNGIGGGGDGYDTHSDHSDATARNLWNTLSTLRKLIDSNDINLDDTLIVLNTEFGRTPYRGEDNTGRDHWPQGYVNVLIGGPVKSRKILGRIQDGNFTGSDGVNGYADPGNVYNASDVRAAVMLAANVNPFENGLFGGGDVSQILRAGATADASANDNTARNIVSRFFG